LRPLKSLCLKQAILLTMFILVSGCATKKQPTVTPEASAKIKRVAVVSVVAQTFSRQHLGVTIYGNETEQLGIADWKIDEHVEARMRAELEKTYKLVAVDAPYPRGDFFQVNKLVGKGSTSFMEPDWKAIKSVTQDYCNKNSLDAVFVFAKIYANVPGLAAVFGGVGIYTNKTIFTETANLFFVSKLALLDCSTGNPLQVRVFSNKQSRDYRYVYRWLPIEEIDYSFARIPVSEWSDEQTLKLRIQLKSLPEAAIVETLKSMFP
jgi:hypothetical protein